MHTVRIVPVSAPLFRVLILNTPPLLGDFLSDAMARHLDFQLIHEREFAREWSAFAPDVVIVGRTSVEQEDTASALLARWPRSLVVTLSNDRRGAALYMLEPTKHTVGDLSPNELVVTIRSTILRDRTFHVNRWRPRRSTTRRS